MLAYMYVCINVRVLDGDSFHQFYGPHWHMFYFLANEQGGGWGGGGIASVVSMDGGFSSHFS